MTLHLFVSKIRYHNMDKVKEGRKRRARNWEKRKIRVGRKEKVRKRRKRKGQKRKEGHWRNEINLVEEESNNSKTSVYYHLI